MTFKNAIFFKIWEHKLNSVAEGWRSYAPGIGFYNDICVFKVIVSKQSFFTMNYACQNIPVFPLLLHALNTSRFTMMLKKNRIRGIQIIKNWYVLQ